MSSIIEIEAGAIAAVSKIGPDEARTARRAAALVTLARSMEVKTQEDYNLAAGELRTIIKFHGELETERTGFTQPLNALLDKMNARFQPYLKALRGDGKKGTESAESILKDKMAAFLVAEEARIAEERRIAEVAAQAERDRLEAAARELREKTEAAERNRLAAEQKLRDDAAAAQQVLDAAAAAIRGKKARLAAEESARLQREQEAERQRIADQEAADQRERSERAAQALETTAAVTIAQPVTTVVSKGRGISTPKTWKGEVTDKLALLKFIVEKRPDLAVLVDVNTVQLDRLVKMMGAGTAVEGVTVREHTSISVR